jgi:glutathione-specific gamma-glutamylcyclotransferase
VVEHAKNDAEDAVCSEYDMAVSLRTMLLMRPKRDAVWIFGYGSLMWKPEIAFAQRRPALLRGWHRRFCLSSTTARGTVDKPGMMLALARGGSCRGVAYRVEEAGLEAELLTLWRREMLKNTYRPLWLSAQLQNERMTVLTFVVNKKHRRYIQNLSEIQLPRELYRLEGSLAAVWSIWRTLLLV